MPGVMTMLLMASGLDQAASDYEHGRFAEVLKAVDRALEGALTPAERLRALELRAKTQVAFGDLGGGVKPFRQLLELAPAYALSASEAPRVRSLLDHARQLELQPPPPAQAAPVPVAAPAEAIAAPAPV